MLQRAFGASAIPSAFLTLAMLAALAALAAATATARGPVSAQLFAELELASRLVGAAYCVGNLGIHKPFSCGAWCEGAGLDGVELVGTWNFGLLDSTSCGYVAISHTGAQRHRIIAAFRGSNSLSDTVYDLMTQPAEYVPYAADNDECENCMVHSGFTYLWNETSEYLTPLLESLLVQYPSYQLMLAGHSLGGAIAGLAALEFAAKGWAPIVTTFGEPRFGNAELAAFVDRKFVGGNTSAGSEPEAQRYRRVTHVGDPVPLLPLQEWGWRMHSGEIFIDKDTLPAQTERVLHCKGPSDPECIRGGKAALESIANHTVQGIPGLPAEWQLWQILFAHRQYFWRVGLCWDPQDYEYPDPPEREVSDEL